MSEKPLFVGVDIGGTWVRVVLADESSILIKISSKTVKSGLVNALPTQIINMIKIALKETNHSIKEIKSIGTSSAGPFIKGELIHAPNICGVDNDWEVIPYIPELRAFFGPDIELKMENDCVAAVKAEHTFGAARGIKDAVYITISTGIGAGLISDNKIIFGKGHNAGHFGHMIIKKDGDLCGCGQRGCIETIASGKNIERRAKEAGFKWNNGDEFTAKEVFQAFRNNDPIAKKVIQETLEYLSIFLTNVINITDTSMIILGGSVMKNADIIIPFVQDYITNNSIASISEGVQFKVAELGDWVGDLGGLSLVLPENIQKKWIEMKPWTHEKKEKFLTIGEAMASNPD